MAGAFDQPSGLQGEVHIFVGDKGDYYAIDDGLPQFERSTPSSRSPAIEPRRPIGQIGDCASISQNRFPLFGIML